MAEQHEWVEVGGVRVESRPEVRRSEDLLGGLPASGTNVVFSTGATRSSENLYDPSGFLNPRVLQLYCEYMERHRIQKDGKPRDSDNWQRGMPSSRAYRSLLRHAFDVWLISRGYAPKSADCADISTIRFGSLPCCAASISPLSSRSSGGIYGKPTRS